jgi:hypothetical protein
LSCLYWIRENKKLYVCVSALSVHMRSVFIPPPRSSAELVGLERWSPIRLGGYPCRRRPPRHSRHRQTSPSATPPPAIPEWHTTTSMQPVLASSAPLVSIRELRASPAWRRRRRATPASCPPRTASGGRPGPSRTAPASSSPGLACSVGRPSHVRACRNRGRREYWIFLEIYSS